MNGTHPVSRTASTPASVNSSKPGGPAPDFAAALTGAAAKPARKAGGHKTAGTGVIGGHLPADGNASPPAAPPAPTSSAAASAASFAAGAAGTATAGLAVDSGTGAMSAIPGAAVTGTAAKIQASGSAAPGSVVAAPDSPDAGLGAAAMKLGAGFALALGLPLDLGVPRAAGADGTPSSSISGNPSPAPTVAAPSIPAARLAGAQAAVAAPGHVTNMAAASAATAALKAATSGPSSNDGAFGSATNASAATADGTTAPAADAMSTSAAAMSASAAAMSAAATGLVVSNSNDFAGAADAPSFTADAVVSPGAKTGPGTQAPDGAPALAATRAAAATAAHANTQAVSAVADAGASDKHTAGGAGPAPLSGVPGDAAAGAAQSSVNPSSVTGAVPAPMLRVPAGVDTPEFGQGLADRVSWMVDNNLNGAKLQVNPPQLGPIEVRISVQGGHAQVWFTSHSAVTRDALESSSPKLREMLGAQGFGQVSVDISQGSFHERPAHSQPYEWTPSANRGPSAGAVQATAISPRASSGALDAYA